MIEGNNTKAKFSTVFVWLIALAVGTIIGATFSHKFPYLNGKGIHILDGSNNFLLSQIESRNKSLDSLKFQTDTLLLKQKILDSLICDKDSLIKTLQLQSDSITDLIKIQDSIIIITNNGKIKDLDNIRNMDINDRVMFFSEYFASKGLRR